MINTTFTKPLYYNYFAWSWNKGEVKTNKYDFNLKVFIYTRRALCLFVYNYSRCIICVAKNFKIHVQFSANDSLFVSTTLLFAALHIYGLYANFTSISDLHGLWAYFAQSFLYSYWFYNVFYTLSTYISIEKQFYSLSSLK